MSNDKKQKTRFIIHAPIALGLANQEQIDAALVPIETPKLQCITNEAMPYGPAQYRARPKLTLIKGGKE